MERHLCLIDPLLGDRRYLSHVCLGLFSSYRCCLEVPRELFQREAKSQRGRSYTRPVLPTISGLGLDQLYRDCSFQNNFTLVKLQLNQFKLQPTRTIRVANPGQQKDPSRHPSWLGRSALRGNVEQSSVVALLLR
jgi:hypothetical protein